jgi:hypothetical protein
MTVYVLIYGSLDGPIFVGVYRTRKEAEVRIAMETEADRPWFEIREVTL